MKWVSILLNAITGMGANFKDEVVASMSSTLVNYRCKIKSVSS